MILNLFIYLLDLFCNMLALTEKYIETDKNKINENADNVIEKKSKQ